MSDMKQIFMGSRRDGDLYIKPLRHHVIIKRQSFTLDFYVIYTTGTIKITLEVKNVDTKPFTNSL